MSLKQGDNLQLRVSVDFNTTGQDEEGRVIINTRLKPALKEVLLPDMRVTLYDETLEVEANIEVSS